MSGVDMAHLYREHRGDLVAYLRRHGCDKHLAEDLTQDVFVKAIRTAGGYTDRGKPLAWLYTIARNLLLDHRRGAAFRTTVALELRDTDMPVFGEAPDDLEHAVVGSFTAAATAAVVREVLADLTPKQRQVVALRFFEELSVLDTARKTEQNEAAVKALQARACRKLARDDRLAVLRAEAVAA